MEAPRSERLWVATRKGVFSLARQEPRWRVETVSFLGVNATLAAPDPRDGSVLAALEHGHFGVKLHRSQDHGRTWSDVTVPAYPERPADATDTDPMRGTPLPWKLVKIWALSPGGADEPGRIWAGTIPGGLFTSTDGGASWELVRGLWDHPKRPEWFGGGADLPGIHSVCVDPRDSRRVAVGVSCGGVWLTEDRGASWACRADGMWAAYMPPDRAREPQIQDPHRLVQSPADPTLWWVQHHNGVFRSTDDLASWQEIKSVQPSVFGFAVAAHPKEARTAWFVPAVKDEIRVPVDASVVVARTRDGGETFEVLRNGLPQEHAYDLVYRHGLAVDRSGSLLAMGSTTGSLWLSEDGGESWLTLSKHLPPIHSVAFD